MYLDAIALGVPAVLGLLGAWRGFGRFLVSWPIRWLVSALGASIAALLAALYLAINRDLAALVYLSGTVATIAICAVAFLIVLALLLMFMSNFSERVLVWTSQRSVGAAERLFGGVSGMAFGLVLIAVPFALYESLRPDRGLDPPWARESLLLPYFRSTAEAVRSTLSSYLPDAAGQPRRQR